MTLAEVILSVTLLVMTVAFLYAVRQRDDLDGRLKNVQIQIDVDHRFMQSLRDECTRLRAASFAQEEERDGGTDPLTEEELLYVYNSFGTEIPEDVKQQIVHRHEVFESIMQDLNRLGSGQ